MHAVRDFSDQRQHVLLALRIVLPVQVDLFALLARTIKLIHACARLHCSTIQVMIVVLACIVTKNSPAVGQTHDHCISCGYFQVAPKVVHRKICNVSK